jgi:hypothetical protein
MNPKNKLIIFILLVCLIGAGLYFFKNSQSANKEKQDGVVSFSLDGQKYEIPGVVFIIRADFKLFEGDKIKVLSRGEKANFMFSLVPTLKKQKDDEKYLKIDLTNLSGRSNYKSFDASWAVQTDNPEGLLKTNEISYKNSKISLAYFYIRAELPTLIIGNQQQKTHEAWIKITSITQDRITGKFGGRFQIDDLNRLGDRNFFDNEIEITDGTFDVPYYKYFKYE